MRIVFNLNDCVLVRLTEFGRESWMNAHKGHDRDELAKSLEFRTRNGWTRFQFHDFMYFFGAYMWVGNGKQVIENNEFHLVVGNTE